MTIAALDAHLAVLTGDGRAEGWLEIRYRTPRGMRSRFYPARGRHRSLQRLVENLSPRSDVYIGCAIRRVRRGDRAAIASAWTAWAELDTPDADDAIDAFAKPASLVIASGSTGHRHIYWKLTKPATPDQIADANRRLALAVGADLTCCDPGRILRPAGSVWHKAAPPRPVFIVQHDPGRSYELDELTDGLPASRSVAVHHGERDTGPDALLTISPEVYVPALVDQPLGRDRKVSCPFHEDRTPSLHAYPTPEQGWYCFGACRRGGSIYDLAGAVWLPGNDAGSALRGTQFVELRERLLTMFFND